MPPESNSLILLMLLILILNPGLDETREEKIMSMSKIRSRRIS
jgi:hypothetical protein